MTSSFSESVTVVSILMQQRCHIYHMMHIFSTFQLLVIKTTECKTSEVAPALVLSSVVT
jgi:hypothetical protein